MYAAYRGATRIAEILSAPMLFGLSAWRPRTWGLRAGRVAPLPTGRIWLHAASVGELLGAAPLLAEIRRVQNGALPLVSTTSQTGYDLAGKLQGGELHRTLLPLDLPGCVARALDAALPSALIVCETEIWPNLFLAAAARGIPVAIVNGRLSPRRFGRYRALRPLFTRPLRSLSWIAAQTAGDRARFLLLGAPSDRVEVVGSTKGDTPATLPTRAAARAALGLGEEEKLIVFGSVRTPEDGAAIGAAERLMARFPQLRILYAPRHPARSAALAERLGRAAPAALLTSWRARPFAWRALVVDTLGELASLYPAADAAFVGGSLSPHGGHNPLEPARAGVPLVMGPNRQNVADLFSRLASSGGAIEAGDAAALERALAGLLENDAERRRRGAAVAAAAAREGTVSERVVRGLLERGILPLPAGRSTADSLPGVAGAR